MNYCENCHGLSESTVCHICGKQNLRPVQPQDYCFLTEQEEMWAKMLMKLLEEHGISPLSFTTLGSGVTMKTGKPERYKIYVPYDAVKTAQDLMEAVLKS